MLEVRDIYKSYRQIGGGFGKKGRLPVLKGVSFSINPGDCVGLVGESGSGKSTLSRLILGLEKADEGSITIEGKTIRKWIKENKGQMSVVFQDYTSSVNPSFTIRKIISEPLKIVGQLGDIDKKVEELLEKVGLPISLINRYPHELSGGQLQRVCIARAISTQPKILLLDEAVSSLDVSVQVQIIELLRKIKEEMNMTYLFIAHDLPAVSYLCDTVLFLYKGQIIEQIPSNDLVHVKNEYAQRLLDSVIPFHI